ncbi:glycosyltransferase family 4 protein [Halogeometricum limi]|uniref:Glycosyltransferase involved in cell wall bisynthesis n=1 Tax=Halogeometricum limi TaxID=555875 RepID=A0A1I6GGQ9_9EURY|nr:glycosyltransferase family 4 protein [Halogeometricum limi]SFR41366.1 Glycosyltransferase involved in cell wall bisynthesis [Halogeometricum limi]
MRVLYVTSKYPPHTGGVETHVEELAAGMVERGHDVTVFSADDGPDVETTCVRDGVSVRRFDAFAPGDAYHAAPGIFTAVRAFDADVVHGHNYHSLPLAFAAAATTDPFVATPHYHAGSASGFRDALLRLYAAVGRRALERARQVVAVSEWERRRLDDDFGIDATVIPNGLHVDRFAGAEPFDRDRPYLLCVGRVEEYKGVQFVVDAMTELPEYDLLVAGSGSYSEELKRRAESRGVADRVEFLGYVADEELPGLYAGAAAFVTMSSFEAYGMTVAEALAAGTPCVVREAGALVDWVGRDDCVGVDDPTPSTVAAAVGRAAGLDAPSESLPRWDAVCEETERVYESLVSDETS